MLLVRLAPGVWAMSSRLISVVGVTVIDVDRLSLAHYHCGLLYRCEGELEVKYRREFEATVTVCCSVSKPALLTEIW